MTQSETFFNSLNQVLSFTAFPNFTLGHLVLICIGLVFIYLAIAKQYSPMLLLPIGFGILIGNIAFHSGLQIGINESGSMLNYLHTGVLNGVYPSLIFLGLGAITDFSSIIANPKLILIGAAAQVGIFGAYFAATALGFSPSEASSIGIIGCAGAPTAIFLSAKLAPNLLAIIAVTAYLYMALVPVIQPTFMKLFTSAKEREIKMKSPRAVSVREKIFFPIIGLFITCLIVPAALPLLGMLFLGNLLKESMVTKRLLEAAKGPVIDIVTILLGLTIGASLQAAEVLNLKSLQIIGIGLGAFVVATIFGVLFVKFMNLFLKEGNKINPLIGNAGVSALPDSARVSQTIGLEYDKSNHLLMHAMGPNVAGVIGSAVAAGIMLSFLM